MSTPSATAAAGWYADPVMPNAVRYFDGTSWTQHVAAAPVITPVVWGASTAFPAAAAPRPGVGQDPSDPVHWLVPTGRSWQSITAGYLGIFLLVPYLWFLGPFALGFGIWALRVSSRTGSHGRGRAVFGVVMGAIATLGLGWYVIWALTG
ncbi:MAG: hypothetical protein QOJ49_1302 [Actinomycetota bacterium]|jgi:hypothetical protein|nr:hypothetical protein [Actinomycetota bacterium]